MFDYIERLKQKVNENIKPRFTYAKFPIKKTESEINVCSTILTLEGNDIRKLLEYSDECIIMAVTLGIEIDRLISSTQITSIADASIMDTIASDIIEDICDNIQNELGLIYNLTQRYSCGYGDLPISIQPKILAVLNTQKAIGLFCNKNNIMIPRKSVTAILGITSVKQDTNYCESCRLKEECSTRKAGDKCGRQRIC